MEWSEANKVKVRAVLEDKAYHSSEESEESDGDGEDKKYQLVSNYCSNELG